MATALKATPPATDTRQRLIDIAAALFTRHSFAGTSLQMIADEFGVTKAAVYHQFPTKDEIVLTVIGPVLDGIVRIADAADQQRTQAAKRDTVLNGVADLVVGYRRMSSSLTFDPVVMRLIHDHPFMKSLQRIRRILGGAEPDPGSRVRLAVLLGGLIMAPADPAVTGLDDEDFRAHLLITARRVLGA